MLSAHIEENLSPIVLRSHGEVKPPCGATLLVDQLIQFPAVLISRVQQDTGIADHLLRPSTADVYSTTRQMIRAFCPTTEPIHLLAPIPRGDDDGDLACRIAVLLIIPLSQYFLSMNYLLAGVYIRMTNIYRSESICLTDHYWVKTRMPITSPEMSIQNGPCSGEANTYSGVVNQKKSSSNQVIL